MALAWRLGAPGAEDATGCTERGAQPLGERPKRLAIPNGPRVGHTIESSGGQALGMHGEGGQRCPVQWRDWLPYLPRDARDGRRHFWHDALGLRQARHAALAEPCVLGDRAHRRDGRVEISGHELAVATDPAVEIDPMVGVADATDALGDVRTWLREALLLTTGRFQGQRGWLQAPRVFWGAARTALCGEAWSGSC
jgi:hypothetical protein